ncbi:sporulation integral membrane protein YtvI [Bacilliculturomica massiliensis]|uniref:sporulation integral membrane protein YtvI n=1 Tax=Bacilliculturomica massiliensis TaxID=1917867 RepID=UPI00102F54A6|nr:sporulation integral membrane protein YtvI [Bacilliculturomica massiliensis]
MDIEKRKRFLINAAYCATVAAIVYIVFRYALFWLMPFVVGFGVAFVLKPVINGIAAATHIKRKPVAAVTVLLFYATIGVGIAYAVFMLAANIKEWILQLPEFYDQTLEPALLALVGEAEKQLSLLDPVWIDQLQNLAVDAIGQMAQLITGFSRGTVGVLSGAASSVPVFFVSVLFSIISSFFFAMDYYRITTFIVAQFDEKKQSIIFDIKDYVVGTVFKMICSYATIMFITFVELYIGFSILGVDGALSKAAVIALVDILPVLGTGGVVIPWIIIEFITGDMGMAAGLVCVYLFVTVVRNIIEPKIVGNQVGLPPLVMLLCLFVGVKLFGALGIVIMPFMAIVIKNLNDSGKIHVFNSPRQQTGEGGAA